MSSINFFYWSQQDGAFLVRDCSMNTDSEPLVLSVYHEKRVFNVKIRYFEATSKYALGTQQHSNNVRGPTQFSRHHILSLRLTSPLLLRCLTRWRISSSSTPFSPSCWSAGEPHLGASFQRTVCWRVPWRKGMLTSCCCSETWSSAESHLGAHVRSDQRAEQKGWLFWEIGLLFINLKIKLNVFFNPSPELLLLSRQKMVKNSRCRHVASV